MHVCKYAFIQAKIQGLFAKAYLGEKLKDLLRLRQISELYKKLFPDEPVDVPERELLATIQQKLIQRNISTFQKILSLLKNPPEVLVQILRRYEYRNIKQIVRRNPATVGPDSMLWNIGEFARIRLQKEIPFQDAFTGTAYEWLTTAGNEESVFARENRLDRQFYEELWAASQSIPSSDRRGIPDLISLEILLQNVIWALRLRVYFHKPAAEAREMLIPIPDTSSFPEILRMFSFQKDNLQEWESWKYSWLIKDQLYEDFRGVDPALAEQNAVRFLYRRHRRLFHRFPFTVTPIFCFFRLKDFEADILQSLLEAVRISIPEDELIGILGGL